MTCTRFLQVLRDVLLVALLALGAPAWACCDLTIYVDFDHSGTLKDGFGNDVTTAVSGLAAADRTAIVDKIREKYAGIAGVGTVTVQEGAIPAQLNPGQYGLVISGGNSPGTGEFGNAGAKGGPALVYLGQIKSFTEPGTGDTVSKQADLDTVVGETGAHEVAHRVTKKAHNAESPASAPNNALMVRGGGITLAQRIADVRSFTAKEVEAIQKNYLLDFDPSKLLSGRDLPVYGGVALQNPAGTAIEDALFGARIWYTGLAGWTAGYLNANGDFVYQTANQSSTSDNDPDADFMGFLFNGSRQAGWDMALRDGSGTVFDFDSYGVGNLFLDELNPNNSNVFLRSRLDFDIGGNAFSIFLDASTGDPTTSGFFATPEPSTISTVALSLLLLGALRRRR